MEPPALTFTEPVMSPPTAEQGSTYSGGCFVSPAAETRAFVQAPEEPVDHPKQLENPVDHSKQLENPVDHSKQLENPMHNCEVQNPEVQELMQSELVQNPKVQELMSSVSEADALMQLPSYVSDALYVADLHPSAIDNEGLLQELFSKVGDVSIIRVIPNSAGRPLCSAYVNFHTVEDACRAWQTLNYHVWMGLPMRIMFSNLDPAKRYNDGANIIVTDLEESIDSQFLHRRFCKLGVVLSSKVELDPSGKSTGRGFIQFQDEKDAMRAIELMNNEELRGKKVYVGPFIRRKHHSEADLMNKNPNHLNPAYTPHFDGDVLSEVLKNETRSIAQNGSLDILFGSSSNSANGSHGIRFGSFEPEHGSDGIRFGSFEPEHVSHGIRFGSLEPTHGSHVLAAGSEALQISNSGGTTSNFDTQRSHSGGETRNESRKLMKRASRAERNKARRLAIIEKELKEIIEGKPASSHDSETAVAEPWPPQPWSVETLKAMLAQAHCTEERLAMLGGTLFPLVSKHTKYFVSDVTNELVKLGIKEIERIMKLSDEAFYQKVKEVKQVVFERIRSLPPFDPTTYPSPDCAEEVKHVIFEEIKNQLPFVPTTVPSLPPVADDQAKYVNVFEVPDFPVPVVPEFLAPSAAPGLVPGIPVFPYPLLPLPIVQPHYPHSAPTQDYIRRPGTGFFEPRVSLQLRAGLSCVDETLGEGEEDEFTFETREDPAQEEEATAAEESAQPMEVSAHEEQPQPVEVSAHEEQDVEVPAREEQAQLVEVSARAEQVQPVDVSAREEQAVEVSACEEQPQPMEVSAHEEQPQPVEVSAHEEQAVEVPAREEQAQLVEVSARAEQVQPVDISAHEEQAEPAEEPVHEGAPREESAQE